MTSLNQRTQNKKAELLHVERQITRIKRRLDQYYTQTDDTYLNNHINLANQLENEIRQMEEAANQ